MAKKNTGIAGINEIGLNPSIGPAKVNPKITATIKNKINLINVSAKYLHIVNKI